MTNNHCKQLYNKAVYFQIDTFLHAKTIKHFQPETFIKKLLRKLKIGKVQFDDKKFTCICQKLMYHSIWEEKANIRLIF